MEKLNINVEIELPINDSKRWIREYNHNISFYPFTINGELLTCKMLSSQNTKPLILVCMFHDDHCYLVINDEISGKQIATAHNLLNMNDNSKVIFC